MENNNVHSYGKITQRKYREILRYTYNLTFVASNNPIENVEYYRYGEKSERFQDSILLSTTRTSFKSLKFCSDNTTIFYDGQKKGIKPKKKISLFGDLQLALV